MKVERSNSLKYMGLNTGDILIDGDGDHWILVYDENEGDDYRLHRVEYSSIISPRFKTIQDAYDYIDKEYGIKEVIPRDRVKLVIE